MKKNKISNFDELLNVKYGKRGTKERESWEQEFEAFKLGVCIEEARKKIADADEEYIRKVTGFTPGEILTKLRQLGTNFEGKKSAPFDFELY